MCEVGQYCATDACDCSNPLDAEHLVIECNFQQIPEYLTSYSDATGAFDTEIMKSTSDGVITFGKHYIKSWSKTQAIVALSSAES